MVHVWFTSVVFPVLLLLTDGDCVVVDVMVEETSENGVAPGGT